MEVTVGVSGRVSTTFAALRVPNFRKYLSGQAVSLIGTWTETVAQAVLVLQLTGSGIALGVLTALRYAPVLLLSGYAGVVVDRHRRLPVLMITQAGLALVSVAMAVSVLSGRVTVVEIAVLAVLFGALTAFDNPARQAFVPELVGRDLIGNAVTLTSTCVNLARVVGPAVAATLIATTGIGWCFVVNAASFGFVLLRLVALDTRGLPTTPPGRRAPRQLREGLAYVRGRSDLARPILMMAVIGIFTFEFEVSLPLLAHRTFHGDATTYAWLLGAFGVGALAGGIRHAYRPVHGTERLTRIAVYYAAAMAALAVAPTVPMAVGAGVAVGAATLSFLTTGNTTIQLASDPAHRGRVTALWSLALVGSTPIGSPIIGAIGESVGPRWALGVGALACLVAALVGRRSPGQVSEYLDGTRDGAVK